MRCSHLPSYGSPGVGQHLMLALPGHLPVTSDAPWHLCVVSSRHSPSTPSLHPPLLPLFSVLTCKGVFSRRLRRVRAWCSKLLLSDIMPVVSRAATVATVPASMVSIAATTSVMVERFTLQVTSALARRTEKTSSYELVLHFGSYGQFPIEPFLSTTIFKTILVAKKKLHNITCG